MAAAFIKMSHYSHSTKLRYKINSPDEYELLRIAFSENRKNIKT